MDSFENNNNNSPIQTSEESKIRLFYIIARER